MCHWLDVSLRFSRLLARHALRCAILLSTIAATFSLPAPSKLEAQPNVVIRLPETNDAWLEDVVFVDRRHGWACGRGGVIWHTADGGQNWELQHAEPGMVLHCVRFLDELHGWAVGGTVQPMSWRTSAVLLRTSSGGRRWTRVETPGLPELTHIKFFDQNRGVAAGYPSALYPTGILQTADGGRSWLGLGGAAGGPWTTSLWRSPTDGVLLSDDGVCTVRNGKVLATTAVDSQLSSGRILFPTPDGEGYWVAGTSALLRVRRSNQSPWERMEWQLPPAFQPASLDRDGHLSPQIAPDFHAAATHGDHIWLAGAPGSFVLHSPDGGKTWERQLTGQPLPLTALYFVDENHGWAVGALGVILATRNGGATWHVQRQGGVRLAIWDLQSSERHLPLPLLAYFASQEGWLVGATCLQPERSLLNQSDRSTLARRLIAATERVGATAASVEHRFPITAYAGRADLRGSMSHWQARYGPQAERRWMDYLQWQFSQWRPDVVAFGRFDSERTDGVDRFIHRTLTQWVQIQNQSPEASSRLRAWGLEPWRPRKLVEWTSSRQRAHRSMPITQLLPLVFSSAGDYAWPARLYLGRLPQQWPEQCGWRIVWRRDRTLRDDTLVDSSAERSIGYIRRKPAQVTLQLRRINQIAQALKDIHESSSDIEHTLGRPDWQGQLQRRWQELPPVLAGQSMFQFSLACAEHGHWDAAEALITGFVQQFPTHRMSEPALWWLVRHRGSHEIRVAQRRKTSEIQQAAFQESTSEPTASLHAWEVLTSRYPETSSDPLIALPHASRILLTDPAEARRVFGQVANVSDTRWSRLAKAELWLSEPRGNVPVPTVSAAAVTRPVLDGDLSEEFWKDAPTLRLTAHATPAGEVAAPQTSVKVAYDRAHLYVAFVCEKSRSERQRRMAPRTSRDTADRSLDHLRWEIDVDRDYSTAFEFTVDCRGWVSDSCCQALSWDPQWYVAARESSREWVVECAIPWSELNARPPRADAPMAIRFTRAQPGAMYLQWPAADIAEWGWLMGAKQDNLSEPPPSRQQP